MTDSTVLYEVSNGVARIVLNRPGVNALNLEMIKGVVAAFETAGKDESIRAVVLASAVSKAFSAGLDRRRPAASSFGSHRETARETDVLFRRLFRECPLLAQSGHAELHCTCPLSGVVRDINVGKLMSGRD